MANGDQIQGLPAGATVKPITQTAAQTPGQTPTDQIEGLPAGAIVKPIQKSPNVDFSATDQPSNIAAIGSAVKDIGTGVVKGATQTLTGAGELINKISGGGRQGPLLPPGPLKETENWAQPQTMGETAGVGLEGIAEWATGDAVLGRLAKMASMPTKLLELTEKYPTTAKILANAARGSSVGATEGGFKGASRGQAKQEAEEGAIGGAAGGAVTGGIEAGVQSKLGRSMINQSVGANARDVMYGNPAKALLDENIKHPTTGDLEAYKNALRSGKPLSEAQQAAGGRFAAVSKKLDEYRPQLNAALAQAQKPILVADVIDKPIQDAVTDILANRAIPENDKVEMVNHLAGLEKSLKQGLGPTVTPSEANLIKQQIGNEGAEFEKDTPGRPKPSSQVIQTYRSIYGTLKGAIEDAAPQTKEINERVTNLMAAHKDLARKMGVEETAAPAGKIGKTWLGVAESGAGKVLPAAKATAANPVTRATVGTAGKNLINVIGPDGKSYQVDPSALLGGAESAPILQSAAVKPISFDETGDTTGTEAEPEAPKGRGEITEIEPRELRPGEKLKNPPKEVKPKPPSYERQKHDAWVKNLETT